VGYAGGSKRNPTYHDLGDHSETIQIDYDPTEITYKELLDVFWNNHSPTSRSVSRQYASIIFTHDEEQERLAMETKEQEEAETGQRITTEIVPYTEFWQAEHYHQKYRLRGVKALWEAFKAMYPDFDDLVNSTAAARVNGYVGGHGTTEQLEEEIDKLGLSSEAQEKLREIAERRLR
jgi:peptide-methionine (S)-S-oxide reductase